MKIRFLTPMASSELAYEIGTEHEFEDAEAQRLVDAGFAEEAKTSTKAKTASKTKPKVETATAPEVETPEVEETKVETADESVEVETATED